MFNSNPIGKVLLLKVQRTYPIGFVDRGPFPTEKKINAVALQACIAFGFQNTYRIPYLT